MGDELYMNGRGVLRRTRELSDDLFMWLPAGIFGSTLALMGPLLSLGIFSPSYRREPVTGLDIAIAVFSILIGFGAASIWFRALFKLRSHRQAMEAETAKRGKGWARD